MLFWYMMLGSQVYLDGADIMNAMVGLACITGFLVQMFSHFYLHKPLFSLMVDRWHLGEDLNMCYKSIFAPLYAQAFLNDGVVIYS